VVVVVGVAAVVAVVVETEAEDKILIDLVTTEGLYSKTVSNRKTKSEWFVRNTSDSLP